MKIPYEYFCMNCGQLRLCLDKKLTTCGNCNSPIKIIGKVGELNGKKLKADYYARIQH
jgi:molybdenum cofactor biosynthesis enzyme MoaA